MLREGRRDEGTDRPPPRAALWTDTQTAPHDRRSTRTASSGQTPRPLRTDRLPLQAHRPARCPLVRQTDRPPRSLPRDRQTSPCPRNGETRTWTRTHRPLRRSFPPRIDPVTLLPATVAPPPAPSSRDAPGVTSHSRAVPALALKEAAPPPAGSTGQRRFGEHRGPPAVYWGGGNSRGAWGSVGVVVPLIVSSPPPAPGSGLLRRLPGTQAPCQGHQPVPRD